MKDIDLSFIEPMLRFIFIANASGRSHFAVVLGGLIAKNRHEQNIVYVTMTEHEHAAIIKYLDAAIDKFSPRGEKAKRRAEAGP